MSLGYGGMLVPDICHAEGGMFTSSKVGPPAGLSCRDVPSAARMRFAMPSIPPPGTTRAPPTPLSSIRAERLSRPDGTAHSLGT